MDAPYKTKASRTRIREGSQWLRQNPLAKVWVSGAVFTRGGRVALTGCLATCLGVVAGFGVCFGLDLLFAAMLLHFRAANIAFLVRNRVFFGGLFFHGWGVVIKLSNCRYIRLNPI